MGDDSEWKKLPTDEKIQHKVWKARVEGYEEAINLFQTLDDPKNSEYFKYLGLLKKMILDNNAVAQEKALDVVLCYAENAACAGKAAGDVCSALISKCLMAPKQKTKEKAMEILLMYIEIEKQDVVQEELLKGLQSKQPKSLQGSLQTLREGLRQFGPKVISIKPLVKEFIRLIEDRDKGVRDESKLLAVEMFRWVGDGLRSQFTGLKPVHLSELDAEIANLPSERPMPERYLKSQQDKIPAAVAQGATKSSEGDAPVTRAGPVVEALDPYDLVDAVDILAKMPKDFYDKIELTKWQERREALEAVEKLTEGDLPKFESGDYGDLMRALLKVVNKDTNVMLVAMAARIVNQLARGLRKKFAPYAPTVVKACLDKFKEKKVNVVTALRDAIDNSFALTTWDAMMEDILAALGNKNPAIRAETSLFLARAFKKETQTSMNKKLLKQLATPLGKATNDTVPEVREAVCEAVGTLMKVVTEKNISPFLGEIDTHKSVKIKEYFDKVELVGRGGGSAPVESVPASRPNTAPPKTAAAPTKRPGAPPPAKRPTTAAPKTGGGKPSAAGGKKPAAGKAGAKPAAGDQLPTEHPLSDDQVADKALDILGKECLDQLENSNWKERLAGMEHVDKLVKGMPGSEVSCQLIVKVISSRKPGLKDNNFQVLKNKLDLLTYLAQETTFTKTSADVCMEEIFEKIGDVKTGEAAKAALTAIAEACSLEYVGIQLAQTVFNLRNPKNQAEGLNWLSQAIKEFGLKISAKELIKYLRAGYQATNPAVRTAAVNLTASLYLYMGETLRILIQDEKPALLQNIDTEIDKIKGQKPPAPIRGVKGGGGGGAEETTEGGGEEDEVDGGGVDEDEMVPRMDISGQLTEALFEQLTSKNWKERNEGLQQVAAILLKAKFVTGNLEELPQTLIKLCADSNRILAKTSLGLVDTLFKAMQKNDCKNIYRQFLPPLVSTLSDVKIPIRQAAVQALNTLCDKVSFQAFAESELLTDSLKAENPILRLELIGWIGDQLNIINQKKSPKARKVPPELRTILPIYFTCLEDRNPDLRKKCQEVMVVYLTSFGYDVMIKALSKVRPASKDALKALVDKAREQVPAPSSAPTPVSRPTTAPSGSSEPKPVAKRPATAAASKPEEEEKPPSKAKGLASKTAPVAAKKKVEDDVPAAAVLSSASNKEQRFADEKKRKLLKWDFDTPTKEHHAQLQSLLTPNCSPELAACLFHSDFKQHIKAIEILSKFMDDGGEEATRLNLDLLLKWMVMRFFETNPSVLIRGLEYLNKVLTRLSEDSYNLHESEARSFIGYLVMKAGDPKENIRKDVRAIFKLLCQVYPANKFFPFIMDGTLSKVAKQRQECLEELGCLIETYGLEVCQPTPAVALKSIATQIADRDSGVRTASLNTLVTAYNTVGEQIYKLVGNLNDKERSMLEERIKRTGRIRGEGEPANFSTATFARPSSKAEKRPEANLHQAMTAPAPQRQMPQRSTALPPGYQLDIHDDMETSRHEMPKLIQVDSDLHDIYKPIDRPAIKTTQSSSQNFLRNSVDATSAITMVTTQISATDVTTSIQALAQIDEVILNVEKRDLLLNYVDQLLMMMTMQFKMVTSKHMEDPDCSKEQLIRLLKCLLATLLSLFGSPTLAREASRDRLKELLHTLANIMLDERFLEIKEGDQVVRSINVMYVKIIDGANKTRVLCCLLRLLHESVETGNITSKFLQLVMKCLWRTTRNLQKSTVDEYSLEAVFQECHNFLRVFPSASWKTKKSDVPLRTVKTLIHTLCNLKGQSILEHMDSIANKEDSELEAFIKRTLKTVEVDANGASAQAGTFKCTSKSLDKLKEIFNRIGSKEYTREGLNDLYDYLQANPDTDLEPYTSKTSLFFQRYINQGIKNIEMERARMAATGVETRREPLTQTADTNRQNRTGTSGGPVNPQIFLDRLKAVRKEFGLDTSMTVGHGGDEEDQNRPQMNSQLSETGSLGPPSLTAKTNTRPTDHSQHPQGNSGALYSESDSFSLDGHSKDEDDTTVESKPTISHNELSDLKRRLERIKNQQK